MLLDKYGSIYLWEQSGELNGMTRVRPSSCKQMRIFSVPQPHIKSDKSFTVVCIWLRPIFETLEPKDYRVRVDLMDSNSSEAHKQT